MRNLTLFISTLLFGLLLNAQTEINYQWKNQINSTFSGLNKTKVPHHLLQDYAMEFIELSAYNGNLTSQNLVHKGHYTAIYNTLLMARTQTNVPGLVNPTIFKQNWDAQRQANIISLSGLYYKYSKIKTNAYPNSITVNNNKYYDKYVGGVWQNPYQEQQVFAMALPILKYNSLQMQVRLPASLWYTNQANTVQNISVDFGNGQGYQNLNPGQNIQLNYAQSGTYEWKYKLTLTNGQVLYSHSKIQIKKGLNHIPWADRNK